jgi:hypothetical protein
VGTDAGLTAGRRLGHLIGAAVNGLLLVLVNVSPGWEAVPFLTGDAAQVVPLVNASLIVSAGLELARAVADPPWLRALGNVVTTGISLAVMVRSLQVFPFDFSASEVDWDLWVRMALWFLSLALGIALIVQVAQLARVLLGGSPAQR